MKLDTTSIYAERSIGNENGPAEMWFVATGQPGGLRFREFNDALRFANSIAAKVTVYDDGETRKANGVDMLPTR